MADTPYPLVAKLNSSFKHLNVIANNLANTSTVAKRQDQVIYQAFNFKMNNKDDLSLVSDILTYQNKKNGKIEVTHRPLDVAMEGEGFFSVQNNTGIYYTRAGNFTLNRDRQLSTFNGDLVLDQNNNPIIFQDDDIDILIDKKGFISSANRMIARLSVVKFDNEDLLEQAGNNLYKTPSLPIPADDFLITQKALEKTNIESVENLTNMITIQRNVELVSNVISAIEGLDKETADSLTKTIMG